MRIFIERIHFIKEQNGRKTERHADCLDSQYPKAKLRKYIFKGVQNKMANNQNDELNQDASRTTAEQEREGFEPTNQGQNIAGGKDEKTIDVGEKSDGNEFSKTDQSITQAAPGQTATNTTQGGSNA